jgi:amino acid permease
MFCGERVNRQLKAKNSMSGTKSTFATLLEYGASIIALVAIFKSFFGHYAYATTQVEPMMNTMLRVLSLPLETRVLSPL